MLHSAWALIGGTVIVLLARERYHLVLWVVLFLALAWASTLLIVGAITMPLLCYLSAFRQPFRHLFFIPVLCVVCGIAVVIWTAALS